MGQGAARIPRSSAPKEVISDSPEKCGTLRSEQIRNEPRREGGGFEKVARRRYQKPVPKRRGEQWSILVREDIVENGQRTRKVKRIVLGPATLSKADAER